ncbi:MAG: sulfurtransferase-like selenium metabolism protein YedF, partial [Desulfobacterales bacterium]|nr:sulfurtransferase-like selenium metabolism protein YedF [Desulfobacterales bacterium]
MFKEIDARGLSCPMPILKAKEIIENQNPTSIKVIVDNQAASQNVWKFLKSQGFDSVIESSGNDFAIIGKKQEESICDCETETKKESNNKISVMITSDKIGHGDDGLGSKLMVNFIKTLKEIGTDLWSVIFVNSGVKLTTEGSEVLSDLSLLKEKNRCNILVCGTCLNHFNLLDKKKIGETTNMLDIITTLQLSDKI